jgi:hypothetical protein
MLSFLEFALIVVVVVFLTLMVVVFISYIQGRESSWEREASREKLRKRGGTPGGSASKTTAARPPGPRSRKDGG